MLFDITGAWKCIIKLLLIMLHHGKKSSFSANNDNELAPLETQVIFRLSTLLGADYFTS